jgi:hypothetical protein
MHRNALVSAQSCSCLFVSRIYRPPGCDPRRDRRGPTHTGRYTPLPTRLERSCWRIPNDEAGYRGGFVGPLSELLATCGAEKVRPRHSTERPLHFYLKPASSNAPDTDWKTTLNQLNWSGSTPGSRSIFPSRRFSLENDWFPLQAGQKAETDHSNAQED